MKKNYSLGRFNRRRLFLRSASGGCGFGLLALLPLTLPWAFVDAAQLKEARVSQVIKDVKLLPAQAAPRPAAVRDEVREGTAVRTGIESRAELTFTDQTLARLGANTIFSFNQGTRNLDLGGGAMLLRVPKDAGGAQINTAAVTAAITGTTVMLEYHPNTFIKFIILEGTGRIFRKGHLGESVLLHAGQMLIVNPNGKGLPDPVDVDLDRLMKTSLLISGFDPLPSGDLIAQAISAQDSSKNNGGLIDTNLVIFGGGTTVALLDPTHTGILDQANSNEVRQPEQTPSPTESPTPTISPTVTPTPTVTVTPTPTVSPTPDKFGTPPVIASSTPYEITADTTISTDPTITTNSQANFGTIYRGAAIDGSASQWFFGSTSAFDSMIGFDQNVFVADRLPVAAFKFSSLDLIGNPNVVIAPGAPNNLALVSVGDLSSGAPGGILTFGGLNLLFLATQNGSITLTSDLTFQDIPNLAVYARGASSTLTFDAAVTGASIVGLLSEGNIAATGSLAIDETSANAGLNGLIISLLAGQAITIGQDLTLSVTNSTVISNALITINSFAGDTTVSGVNGISLTIDNTAFGIGGFASLGVSTGGNFTSSGISLFLDNNEGGSIGNEASVFFDVGGTLTTTDFASLTINNGDTGGTIGSSASLNLSATAISIGSSLDVSIANNAGGSIAGDAILTVSAIGPLTTGTDSGFTIDNSIFSNEGVSVGGDITGNATIGLVASSVNAGGGLFTFLYNDGGGHIGGDALITAGLAAGLSTQGALFFDVQNSADTDGAAQTFPGGTIDGNAAVTVAVSGPVTSTGLGEFAVLNNDFRFLDVGGTISGSATVILSATDLSTGSFFQPLINNTNGSIGGDATVSVALSGDVSVGAETFFNILNSGGAIGGQAFSALSANNYTGGTLFQFQILNENGSIGTNATLSAALGASLTIGGDATIEIGNAGGSVGGNAAISLTAVSLQANSITTLIDSSSGGFIAGAASIALNISGTLTTTTDATVDIALSPPGARPANNKPATVAAIDLNGGTYEVGGTFHSTITGGDGGITIGTASLHADILKIGAFGDNGSLTVGGGLLSGDTQLKLYAPGSNGQINFISNVTLNSNSSVIIAANAVTISNGVVVTITGDDGVDASVFTNVPNYTGSGGNGSTTGTFAGNGAQTLPLDAAPPFDDPLKGPVRSSATSGGGTTTVLPRGGRRPVATARVTDSNDLLELAAQAVGPGAASLDRSSAATGRNAGAVSGKGSLPAAPRMVPASLTINPRESRGPLALP